MVPPVPPRAPVVHRRSDPRRPAHPGTRVARGLDGLITARPPTDAGTIAAPTLIIWGDRDDLLTRDQEEALAAAIPASRLVIYEETGHLVLWEQPERSASDLGTFIESLHSGLPDEP